MQSRFSAGALSTEYVKCHANLLAIIANLNEFVDSMPAVDTNGHPPQSVNWAVLGDYKRLEVALSESLKGCE